MYDRRSSSEDNRHVWPKRRGVRDDCGGYCDGAGGGGGIDGSVGLSL
jgi:hypothetical protein